jgi:hypothetical protein
MRKMENRADAVTKPISNRWKPTVWNKGFSRLIDGCPQRYNYNTSTWAPRHQLPCIPCNYQKSNNFDDLAGIGLASESIVYEIITDANNGKESNIASQERLTT